LNNLQSILKQYWGYSSFRPLQEDIINASLQGNDVLALLPTGGGKSICFQVPALLNEGICIVISPLIALIKDQVENLKTKGINALAIYSGMSFIEINKTLQNAAYGNYKFLYVSPERLETKLFLEYLHTLRINLIAVDEAHCISQWGYDFRPSYLNIAKIREELPNVPVLALTASATKEVQDDICEKLQPPKSSFGGLVAHNWKVFQQSFSRPNLSYSAFNVAGKQTKLLSILKNVPGSGIVYCKSRKHTKEVADLLKLHNINADFYHAGLSNDERNSKQENWIKNKTRIIVCTNAFGMGIDKPDVRVVVHYDLPDCLENYYQEAGRCGRDGKRAYAVLLYNNKEITALQQQPNIRFPELETIQKMYVDVMNYLQIAAGGGEGMTVDFDLANFATTFKHDILIANFCLKVFEQEGLMSYTESFFNPSTLVFITDKNTLKEFENNNTIYEIVIKGLLRSYEGVFDFPTIIYEGKLAKFIGMPIDKLKATLVELHQKGIINYNAQKEKPQLYLLQNRMYADSFLINLENHFKRKQSFVKRIMQLVQYTTNTTICRSVQLANYFNSFDVKACGICDTCINNNQQQILPADFKKIATQLLSIISINTTSNEDLLKSLPQFNKKHITEVLHYLQKEEKININKQGYISLF
jgi:ATP-dependent DNA helicase RecQ